jgi:acetolactate synthase-1/3 small subunit
MLTPMPETQQPLRSSSPQVVLELTVNNHPGVMLHICGLFSRRAFNVEGILCMPIGTGAQSRIWLLVNADHRLEQMIKQLLKLEDILSVRRHSADHEVFVRLEEFFQVWHGCRDAAPGQAASTTRDT